MNKKKKKDNDEQLVMGYWDCPYCNRSEIEGTLRECPSCGAAREKGTEFYLKEDTERILTEEESKTKGKGADWICSACDTLNSVLDDTCKSCGRLRTETDDDYFSYKKKKQEKFSQNIAKEKVVSDFKQSVRKSFIGTILPILLCVAVLLGSIYGLYSLLAPKTVNFHVDKVSWETTQKVEELKTCHESGWSIPNGGRKTDKQWVVKRYKKVLDHYEKVKKSRTKKVLDHYETKYTYKNNGDGTYKKKSHKSPVYRTETEYYTVEEPVYRKEPVYAWKYWYDIDRWKETDTLTQKGRKTVDVVTYAAVNVNEKTRSGDTAIQYYCTVTYLDEDKTGEQKKYKISEEIYEQMQENTDITCKVTDTIIEIIQVLD